MSKEHIRSETVTLLLAYNFQKGRGYNMAAKAIRQCAKRIEKRTVDRADKDFKMACKAIRQYSDDKLVCLAVHKAEINFLRGLRDEKA